MKRPFLYALLSIVSASILAACGDDTPEADEQADENGQENGEDVEDETITFGLTTWTSTEAPTEIVRLILEEAGYNVEYERVDQPYIFQGLAQQDIDFFMDAWLPYTEEDLWTEHEDNLQKVATSYEDAPLGLVVPSYVEEESIEDLEGNAEKFNEEIIGIDPGAGLVSAAEDAVEGYELGDEYDLMTSSEEAMISELDSKIEAEEPVIVTGWRPHSMFVNYDVNLLDDPDEYFKTDNVYVISYDEIEEEHPRAYEILSEWEMDIDDLEAMMHAYEEEDKPFEDSASEWIDENRDHVDAMLNQ
ncbi:glycine betaine ABC transporter substrate-binding protein [Salicibibacter kimchii]|uniref:Glycine/betaine ABC transporter substrate-binding protein n=1 Tax=Salicibibacter kimchii TaxID=2099786 RepID=A0A345C200_9BACI|nr:glycine betaine ABC transporter substrate-binding protein [Salicibibacter kimchii]AXF57231.1 glycine/betaine ABC transporter substrate-binding protein [Salicibibacter kimchii]